MGNGYLYNAAFTHESHLIGSEPDLIAESTGVTDGEYVFDPTLQLRPDTTCYFYSDDTPSTDVDFQYGTAFLGSFGAYTPSDGDLVTPEPASCALAAAGLALLLLARRKRLKGAPGL
jgi:hypothetical protein